MTRTDQVKISTFILYADDANIIIRGSNFEEIIQKFNMLAENLENWVTSNGLAFNLEKKRITWCF